MKIAKNGSSMRQVAYARRTWGADRETKKLTALDVGYSPSVANSVVSKIESRPGYHNAMAALAADSGNIALTVMHELKSRGFEDFSNKDLVGALNAIAGAWDRFNKGLIESKRPAEDNGKNRLRTVILQNISGNVTNTGQVEPKPPEDLIEPGPEDVPNDLDF